MNARIDGYEIRITEPELQAYLQRHPFASGPDPVMNQKAKAAILRGLRRRPVQSSPQVSQLAGDQTYLPAPVLERLENLFQAVGLDAQRQRTVLDDFGWEANLTPRSANRVLVLGCGDGIELLFLRALLPNAEITAIDYSDSISAFIKEAVEVRFLQGDMNRLLEELGSGFDLITSNHTMEHFYTPDQIIGKLFDLLVPGGSLVGTLPMDAQTGSPFLHKVELAALGREVKALDFVLLDSGHPWKATPADLDSTLRRAGFDTVHLVQRADHLSRSIKADADTFRRNRKRGLAMHRLLLGFPRTIVNAIGIPLLQSWLVRTLLAAERRVWFGSNNLKNRYTEEIFVSATKPLISVAKS